MQVALIIEAPSDMFQINITVNRNVGNSGFCHQTSYQNSDEQCNFIPDKSEDIECQTVGAQIVKQSYRLHKLVMGYLAPGYIARDFWLYSHWLYSQKSLAI